MAINRPNVFSSGAATNTDLFLDSATEKLGTASRVFSFSGLNTDIDSLPEYITRSGTALPVVGGFSYDGINSTSASDAAAGIGATIVLVEGVDLNGDLVNEEVALNGTSIVSFANSYYWVNKVQVIEAGSFGTNVGTLTLRDGFAGYQTGIATDGGIPFLGGVAYPRGFYPILKNLKIQVSQEASTATAGDLTLTLTHGQRLNDDPVYGTIRQFNVALGSLNAGAYNIEVDTIRPPHVITGDSQGGFTNVPTPGVFYLRADGDAALNAYVSFSCDILIRDARS